MTTNPIAAARALIEPLTGYTPGPWEAAVDDDVGFINFPLSGYDGDFESDDARLIAAAPALRDMVATLADALEAERAKVAAAYYDGQVDMQSQAYDACREWMRNDDSRRVEDVILALPEPKEASND